MIGPNAHYELYESRGGEPDQDEQDWLRAEQETLKQGARHHIHRRPWVC